MNAFEPVTEPPSVTIITSAAPAMVWAGVVAVIDVLLTTTRFVAAMLLKVTAVAPVKPVPVMVTAVPPANVPDVGEMLVNVGGGAIVVVVAV